MSSRSLQGDSGLGSYTRSWRMVDGEEWKGGERFLHFIQILFSLPFQLSQSKPDSEAATAPPGHSGPSMGMLSFAIFSKVRGRWVLIGAGLCGSVLWWQTRTPCSGHCSHSQEHWVGILLGFSPSSCKETLEYYGQSTQVLYPKMFLHKESLCWDGGGVGVYQGSGGNCMTSGREKYIKAQHMAKCEVSVLQPRLLCNHLPGISWQHHRTI